MGVIGKKSILKNYLLFSPARKTADLKICLFLTTADRRNPYLLLRDIPKSHLFALRIRQTPEFRRCKFPFDASFF